MQGNEQARKKTMDEQRALTIYLEAYTLSNLCSYARKYWRKAIDRGTSGEVGCVLHCSMSCMCFARVRSEVMVSN